MCKTALANSSLLPTKLIRHLQGNHPEMRDKNIEYFKELKSEYHAQSKEMISFTNCSLKAIESSFIVAYEIAKAKKPYLLGEQVIQPCISKVVNVMLGESYAQKLESIPLSHQTIARRIQEMSSDVKSQLFSRLKENVHFTLQFDESTDIVNEAILVGFVRYVHDRIRQNRRRHLLFHFSA